MNAAKDKRLLAALISTSSVKAAAAKVGLSERRVQQRLSEPEFSRMYHKVCADMLKTATADIQRLSDSAVWSLSEVANDREQPAAARVSAAKNLLEYALRLTEQADLIERIEELERYKEQK